MKRMDSDAEVDVAVIPRSIPPPLICRERVIFCHNANDYHWCCRFLSSTPVATVTVKASVLDSWALNLDVAKFRY